MASTRLSETMGTPTLATKFTYSLWVKRGQLGAIQTIASMWNDGNNHTILRFNNDDSIAFYDYSSSSISGELVTNALFRDTSAWYHIVAQFDSTQATAGDRMKLYVNGERITSFTGTEAYPSQNFTPTANTSGSTSYVGGRGDGAYYDGLITHANFIDGLAYQASDFGETDSTSGIWKPKTAPSVTYGTNGFFLKFENSGAMGTDSSGNGNNFTVSGTITQTEDTPSNNFATLNPLTKNSSDTLANGNTKFTATSGASYSNALSTLGFDTGKWYAEVKIASASTYYPVVGIASSEASGNYGSPTSTGYIGDTTGSAGLFMHGDIRVDNSAGSPAPASYTTNDIVGLAVDLDSATKTLKLYKNGTLDQTYTITAPLGFYHFGVSGGGTTSDAVEWNFGNGKFGTTAVASSNSDSAGLGLFEYSVPTGYYALCTKNIKLYGG